jgi:peptide-methionine (S)-S-oxide reductase
MSALDGWLERLSARRAADLPAPIQVMERAASDISPDEVLGETATLGAGCFWCLDAAARRTEGILSSIAGYAGGASAPLDYYDFHRDTRGNVEAVELIFDPGLIDFGAILDLFFRSHDPTTPNQDGANRGPEYHSTIFYHSDEQHRIAQGAVARYEAIFEKPVVTSVLPFTSFFPAEKDHQDFFTQNPTHPYCTFVVVPKLRKILSSNDR